MPKFRKKPVVIEAVKWNGYSNNIGLTNGEDGSEEQYELPYWMPTVSKVLPDLDPFQLCTLQVPAGAVHRQGEYLWIGTLEGAMRVAPGDWIIQGVQGEIYPCKPGIFAATYENAE